MYSAEWARYRLDFNFEARTSRQVMTVKDTYFVRVHRHDGAVAVGECALFRGLSADDCADYETRLAEACRKPLAALENEYSSIRFGFEGAFASFKRAASDAWVEGNEGIPINGLIWMADKETMRHRIAQKLAEGFRVLKLKIGGIAFDDEVELLRAVRSRFSPSELEIRLDANGSFTPENALRRLDVLAPLHIHSLEQPVRAGQPREMARICARSPIAIALDEELIGCRSYDESLSLIESIRPQYIILKPSLCGGFAGADAYIDIANSMDIGWWATSALESNVGLCSIARWLTAKGRPAMPQGLGTGLLYSNNIPSPLYMADAQLFYNPNGSWGPLPELQWNS